MPEQSQVSVERIEHAILMVRGYRVMVDAGLAALYEVKTKVLNQAVRRNIGRFPGDFMFQLTEEEAVRLRSQTVTVKPGRGQHRKYVPYVFTEQGVAKSRRSIGFKFESDSAEHLEYNRSLCDRSLECLIHHA